MKLPGRLICCIIRSFHPHEINISISLEDDVNSLRKKLFDLEADFLSKAFHYKIIRIGELGFVPSIDEAYSVITDNCSSSEIVSDPTFNYFLHFGFDLKNIEAVKKVLVGIFVAKF